MSEKRFELYLSDRLLMWAEEDARPGYRYQFRSPDSDNTSRLYQALKGKATKEVIYSGNALKCIEINDVYLLPVLHTDDDRGFSENYISHLRDAIASQEGVLRGCAMVILHNSLLDTLVNSSHDLAQNGAVWSPRVIYEGLQGLIDEHDSNRNVSKCLLENHFDSIRADGATMFGFEPLYKALLDGDLRFDELGLLNDPLIEQMDRGRVQIHRRLEENRQLYSQLDYVVEHYPSTLTEQLKEFSASFVKEHFPADEPIKWKQSLTYEQCLAEKARNQRSTLELEKIRCLRGRMVTRAKRETKAGRREQHLIIELEESQPEVELEMSFMGNDLTDDHLVLENLSLPNDSAQFVVSSKGTKRCKARVTMPFSGDPTYCTYSTKKRDRSTERFTFHCLVLRAGEFSVEAIQNIYRIVPKAQQIVLQTNDNQLNVSEADGEVFKLHEVGELVDVKRFSVVDFARLSQDSDLLNFYLSHGSSKLQVSIEGQVVSESLSLPLLLDTDRSPRLFDDDYSGEFSRLNSTVLIDNKEIRPEVVRLNLLRTEAKFIEDGVVSKIDECVLDLAGLESVAPKIHENYDILFEYCRERNTVPSLVSWGPAFREIVSRLEASYIEFLGQIEKNSVLGSKERAVLKIGFTYQEGQEYITPLHPLVLSYYLGLSEAVVANRESGNHALDALPRVTIERLTPRGLLPFILLPGGGYAYTETVRENPFWLRIVVQEDSSYDFVPRLVKEKIDEFKAAFPRLFETNPSSPLVINAINQGDCEELFQGLLDYFKHELLQASPVHVNIYSQAMRLTAFDEFSETAAYEQLKERFGLNKEKARVDADSVIDLMRTRLTYSKYRHKDAEKGQSYAHIAFFRNQARVDCVDIDVDAALSGIAADGLLAGEVSESKNGAYFTAFGLKNVEYSSVPHLCLAKLYGSILPLTAKQNAQYTGVNALALAVSESFKDQLHDASGAAIWTTIIDPKVTLDFFVDQETTLIHYSDQYTSSASYDAITVTRNRSLFEEVLKQSEGGKIDEFNAFNGDWLLKMLTAPPTERKGVDGVVGAYKFISGLVVKSDIIWVPLSLAEMVRVSGNIGLSLTGSEFSRYVQGHRSGAISDDILLVGFRGEQIFLLPVEVKTGARPDYQKAAKQSRELRRYMVDELLGIRTLAGKLYRSLFIRQVMIQVEKYQLYKVFEPNYFDGLLAAREQWLRGEFQVAELPEYPKGYVVAFVDNASCFAPDYRDEQEIALIELPFSLLHGFVDKSMSQLNHNVDIQNKCHVPAEYILDASPHSVRVTVEKTAVDDTLPEPERKPVNKEQGNMAANTELVPPSTEPPKVDKYFDQSLTSRTPLRIMFGHDVLTNEAVYWEPTNTDKLFNTNTGIIGTMGTGKTQFTKSMITQLYQNQESNVDGKTIGVLIFDYKADYVKDDFVQATNAKVFDLYHLPFNPFALFGNRPMQPVHTANLFRSTIAKAFGLGARQQNRIRKLVMEAYQAAGISPQDPTSWSRPVPTLADVWALYQSKESIEQDSLYAALDDLISFEIFEPDTTKTKSLYETVNGVTVINLSGYDPQIQNLVVALTLDLFYIQMHIQGSSKLDGEYRQISKFVLVDEADNFMSQDFDSLRKILKEGREFGVGTILSTQELTHFKTSGNEYSTMVLSWIIHQVANIKSQEIRAIFNTNNKQDEEAYMGNIRKLEKHYSLYVDGMKNTKKIKDLAFWEILH